MIYKKSCLWKIIIFIPQLVVRLCDLRFGKKSMNNIARKNIAFVSTIKKSECGIASYTQDLIGGFSECESRDNFQIIGLRPLRSNSACLLLKAKKMIKVGSLSSYIEAADYVNSSKIDLVHIEHEFGIFGGEDGENILAFVNKLKKPFVITFHTVLMAPGRNQKRITKVLAEKAQKIIVMAESAARNLADNYGVASEKIEQIPHGVPEILINQNHSKEKLGYKGKCLVSTFGFINSGKGIEYILPAIREAKEIAPNILFLIIGKTHPKVLLNEGEKYRKSLKELVKEYGLEKNVIFVNRYLSLKDLLVHLKATDIYISAYLEPQQIISGTLAYALGAGRACISTPYLYAKEALAEGRGILVPFRDSKQIGVEIINLIKKPELSKEYAKKAYDFSRSMLWKNVSKAHLGVYEKLFNNI